MKTNLFSFLCMTVMLFYSCGPSVRSTSTNSDDITLIREIRPLNNMSSINVSGISNIVFTQGSVYKMEVEGTRDYVDNTITSVSNGVLSVSQKKGFKSKNGKGKKLTVYITAPTLEKLNIGGVSNFDAEKLSCPSDLKIEISGVGNVDIGNLKSADVRCKLSGTGNMNLGKVNCTDLKLNLSGVSNVNVAKVDCDYLSVKISGTGNAGLNVNANTVDASMSGVGHLSLRGKAKDVNVSKSGMGVVNNSIKKK